MDPHGAEPGTGGEGRLTENLLACVPKGNQEMVAAAFRTIFAQATNEEMATQWNHVRATFAERLATAGALMDTANVEDQRTSRSAINRIRVEEPGGALRGSRG